jgi:endonuclease YncB( thermonuclease family)
VTYGRCAGEVRCGGAEVNPKLVRAGFAWAYGRFAKDPELYARQAAAKAEGLGLWTSAARIPPWERRKGVR